MTDRKFNWDTGEWDPIERRCGRDDVHKAHTWRDEHGGRLSITLMCPGMPTPGGDWSELTIGQSVTRYLGVCVRCKVYDPIPFANEARRDDWWDTHHAFTGHDIVMMFTETRTPTEIRRMEEGS